VNSQTKLEEGILMSNTKAVSAFEANHVSTEDLPWFPYFGEAKLKLIKANPVTGQFITLLKVPANMQLPSHFHPGPVTVYTIQGTWRYIENDWVSKAGDVVCEPAGSKHTPEGLGDEDVITFNIVDGTLDYLGENDEIIARDNWESVLNKYYAHCEAEGIEPVDLTKY
jgi:quercetin dioxygenase-like cupin family protein